MTTKTLKPGFRSTRLLICFAVGVSLPACTNKRSPTPTKAPAIASGTSSELAPTIVIDRPVFHFDYKNTRSLTIAKEDPASGDHWMARVERQQENPAAPTTLPTTFHDDDAWKIQSYSENASLPDRLANRTLILHLLDTLSTLHPVEAMKVDGSSDAVRANFGLSPPRYALQWEVWDAQEGRNRTFQVEIGGPIDEDPNSERIAYGTFPPDHGIYKVDGASLPMLEYIKTFSVLRQQVLSPVTSDNVDEIEIHRGGKKIFYAQRDGDVWSDRKHHPWKKDVQGFLDRITHLRIENFIDTEGEAAPLRAALNHHALEEVVLKGRFLKPAGKTTTIRFARKGARALADVSTRPGAVFELYPGALSRLTP